MSASRPVSSARMSATSEAIPAAIRASRNSSRLLFLDARMAAGMASDVADILAEETGRDADMKSFTALAKRYVTLPV